MARCTRAESSGRVHGLGAQASLRCQKSARCQSALAYISWRWVACAVPAAADAAAADADAAAAPAGAGGLVAQPLPAHRPSIKAPATRLPRAGTIAVPGGVLRPMATSASRGGGGATRL